MYDINSCGGCFMDSNNIQEKLKMYDDFRQSWSLDRMQNLRLEEYTNSNDDSFIYDVEFGTQELGSIKGRNAFIFGIYKRQDLTKQGDVKQYVYGEEYAWLNKFGTNEQEVFSKVKEAVVDVIINAQNGNYSAIDDNHLDSMYKWKIAYLYQNKEDISITPVFTRAALELYARKVGEYKKNLEMSELYDIIKNSEKYQSLEDAICVAENLWDEYINFNLSTEKALIKNDSTLSNTKRRNATSRIELIEYEMRAHVKRRNLHNKLENSFKNFLDKGINANNIVQDDNYIDFQFEYNNKKYICELKPSENQKEINYAIQCAIGQILKYSYDKVFDTKVIVFQKEPRGENLKFLDYLKNEHNIFYLYEVEYGVFTGNCFK